MLIWRKLWILLISMGCLGTLAGVAYSSPKFKIAYIDRSGKVVINLASDVVMASSFMDDTALLRDRNGDYKYIDHCGQILINNHSYSEPFHENIAAAKKHNRYGFINRGGEFIIAPQFEEVLYFHDGTAPVRIDGKFGYVSKTGKLLIEPLFDSAAVFSEGLAAVEKDQKIGFIDIHGRWVLKPQFRYASGFFEGLCLVWDGPDTLGIRYIDKTGRSIITLDKNRNVGPILALDTQDALSHLPSGTGLRIETESVGRYSVAGRNPSVFASGMAALPLDGKFGYIDRTGRFVIAPQFDNALPFTDNRALIKLNGRFGFIDRTGKMVIPPNFYRALCFQDGLAPVAVEDNKWGYIDTNGEFRIEPKFRFATPFSEGLAWTIK